MRQQRSRGFSTLRLATNALLPRSTRARSHTALRHLACRRAMPFLRAIASVSFCIRAAPPPLIARSTKLYLPYRIISAPRNHCAYTRGRTLRSLPMLISACILFAACRALPPRCLYSLQPPATRTWFFATTALCRALPGLFFATAAHLLLSNNAPARTFFACLMLRASTTTPLRPFRRAPPTLAGTLHRLAYRHLPLPQHRSAAACRTAFHPALCLSPLLYQLLSFSQQMA